MTRTTGSLSQEPGKTVIRKALSPCPFVPLPLGLLIKSDSPRFYQQDALPRTYSEFLGWRPWEIHAEDAVDPNFMPFAPVQVI